MMDDAALRIEAMNQARMLGNCCDARTLIASSQSIYEWLSGGPVNKPGKSFEQIINSDA